ELQHENYLSWFKENAKVAWMNRNSSNLSQCSWQKKTPENVTWDEFAGYNSISLMANMPTYSDSIYKDAFARIEAEDMDYCKGLIAENSSGTSKGRSLGGVQNNHYSAYYNIRFGNTGADAVSIRYSKATEGGSTTPATAEIRLDSPTGTLLGSVSLAPTGNWETWSTASANISKITGTHNIYVVYKTTTSYACNVDYIEFGESIVERDGFARIEAESEDNHNGITNNASGTIGGVTNGKWVEYDYVRFNKKATSFYTRLAVPDYAGGTISVYLDSMDNAPIATARVARTGSNWETLAVQKFDLTTPIQPGRYNIFFKFTAENGKTWIADIDYFNFTDTSVVQYSDKVSIEGFQINTSAGGTRTIASVEPQINGSKVKSYGLIYGLKSTSKKTYDVSSDDLTINSSNPMVHSYASVKGSTTAKMGESDTATYFIMTMTDGPNKLMSYTALYLVRAYATLEDGSVVYSDVCSYSEYDVADYLYSSRLLNSIETHETVYNNILRVVNPSYQPISYDWGTPTVKL
ncbi:MAG: carbohydrate-binding protein, partial [Lachnospiraceae bacterium]|nr:carbohydrate-binding protein [Lachnospiraceae bacterium]